MFCCCAFFLFFTRLLCSRSVSSPAKIISAVAIPGLNFSNSFDWSVPKFYKNVVKKSKIWIRFSTAVAFVLPLFQKSTILLHADHGCMSENLVQFVPASLRMNEMGEICKKTGMHRVNKV